MGKLEAAQPSLRRAKMEYNWMAGGMVIAPHWHKIRLRAQEPSECKVKVRTGVGYFSIKNIYHSHISRSTFNSEVY